MAKTHKVQTIRQSIVQAVQSRLRPGLRRVKTVFAEVWGGVRARPKLFGSIAVVAVVAGCVAVLALYGLRKHTLPELQEIAQANPKDASIQVDLGDAYFEAGQRILALKAYDKALQLDKTAGTTRMVENLVACYGTQEMGPAGAIITQYKLEESEDVLRALISNEKRRVRNGALNTLDGLKKARRDDFLLVYTLDLASTDCDVQRGAVEKLGRLGDKRALDEIRAADKKDEADTPWYAFSCLGDRPEDAEEKILGGVGRRMERKG